MRDEQKQTPQDVCGEATEYEGLPLPVVGNEWQVKKSGH